MRVKKRSPTIRDVARLAEVSVATVSAVMNGTANVSAKRAASVLKAMEALDYHADQIARGLKTGRTRIVGMILPDVTNPFYPDAIVGAEEVARAAGYSVMLCNANEDAQQELQQLNNLFSHRVDGVLLACSDPAISLDRLMRKHFPIVCFDRIPLGFRGDTVVTDNFAAGYDATQHLIDLGHRHIAALAGRPELSTHSKRLEGFRKAMERARLPVVEEHLLTGGMEPRLGYELGMKLLKGSSPPTAVFCTNNKLLLGFVRCMQELGVECPGQISVVGFDDFSWTENYHPRLTMIAQPVRELGRRAMSLLLEQIENKVEEASHSPRQIVLQSELRVRESTACLPGRRRSSNARRGQGSPQRHDG